MRKSVERFRGGRPLNIGIRVVGWCLIISTSAMSLVAQPPADEAFRGRARQLEEAVYRRPRAGATFDLWYEHYSRADRQAELAAQVDSRRREAPEDAGAQMVWGLVCERESDWSAAATAFRQAVRLAPDDYYPQARLAEVLMRAGQPSQAAEALSAALARDMPRSERLSLARQLGQLYLQLGNREAAIEVYADVARRFASDMRVVSQMATQLQVLGETDRARQLWQDVRQHARDPETRFQSQWQLARMARQSGDAQSALQQFTQLLDQVQPQSWRAVELERAINHTLVETRGLVGPVEFWQQRLRDRPDDLAALVQATDALANANRLADAAALFEHAIQRAPTRRDLRLGLIELLTRQGKTARAIEQLQQLIERFPNDIELWLALGEHQLQQTDLADRDAQRQAIASWRRALELRPDDGDLALRIAQISRAAAEIRSGASGNLPMTATFSADVLQRNPLLWQAAESFYREALRREPSPANREHLTEFLHRTGQTKIAVETALAIGRDASASQWRDAARTLERFGYLDAARQAAEAAVDADPRELDGWQQWLDVLLAMHDYSAALDAIERMQAIRPQDDDWQQFTWQAQASTMIAAGSIDRQIQSLQTQLADRPDDVGKLWVLAQLKEAAGQRPTALDTMRRIVELKPNDVNVRRRYAAMLAADDQLALAAEQYQALIDLPAPDRREDFERLVDLQLRLHRVDDAAASASRFARQSPRDPEAYLLQAQVAAARRQADGRLAALKRAVQVAPRDAHALRQYAQALVEARRVDEALEVTEQLLQTLDALPQRQATLAWMLTWATAREHHDRVQEHLRRQRLNDSSAADAWTRCLVFWLTETGAPDQALIELQTLLARSPADRLLLEQLVGLAELTRDVDRATRFQQQIVRLDASPSAREKLARLYRQTGRIDEARKIWDQIVDQSMSATEAISLVDQLLRRADYFAAQRVAEAGVSHNPDNWQLVYRAGLLHLAMEQHAAARETLESLLLLPPEGEQGVAGAAPTAGGIELLSLGLAANRVFGLLTRQRHALGSRHARTLDFFAVPELLAPEARSSLTEARIFAAVACLRAMPASVTDANRLAELAQSASDPTAARAVLAAFWATEHDELTARLASWYRDQSDADDLLHWLRLLTFSATGAPDNAALRDLTASHVQLQQRYPVEGRQMLRVYARHLAAAAASDEAWELLERQVAAAPDIGWLVDLASLSSELAGRREQLVNALMTRAAQLRADDSAMRTPATDMQLWLLQLANWDDVAIEPRVELMSQWLPDYLLQSLLQRQRLPGAPQAKPTTALSEFTDRLGKSLSEYARHPLYTPSSAPDEPPASIDQAGASLQSRQRLLRALFTDPSRRLLDDGTVVVSALPAVGSQPLATNSAVSVFPAATVWLDRTALQTLDQIAAKSQTPELRQHILRELSSAEARLESSSSSATVRPTNTAGLTGELQPKLALRLAQVMLHWAWQHYDEAFRQLEELSSADPQNGDLKSLLLRANLERDRLDEAQRWMNELSPDGDGTSVAASSDMGYLQQQLRQRWTKRLHWQDLAGHAGAVSDLAVDPTGQWLASVGVDGTVRVWEVISGRQIRLLQDRGDLLLAVAFSPDGSELAAAGYDRSIRRWRVNDGTPLPPLVGHQGTVRTLDYSSDGRSLVSGADDHRLILWNLSTAEAVQRLDGHRGAVLSARFMPDGQRIVSSGRDQTLRWWNVADGQLQSTVPTTQGTLRSILPLEEFDGVLAAGEDRTLRFWAYPQAAPGAAPAWSTIRAAGSIGDVARRSTEPLVTFGGDDRTVQMWDLSTGREQFALAGHTGRVLSVVRSPDGRWLASGGFDGIIKLWRLQ